MDDVPTRLRYVRRGIGVLIAALPVLLLAASLQRGWALGRPSTLSLVVIAVGLALAALNFYLSFIRRLFVRDGRHISGIPILGTLVIVAGTVIGFASVTCAVLGLIATLLDTGGPAWFLLATWKDKTFWDA